LNKITCGALVLAVCSLLLGVAILQSIQAYQHWKFRELLELDYWQDIVDFKPWIEARGVPFLGMGLVLGVAWGSLIIAAIMRSRMKNE